MRPHVFKYGSIIVESSKLLSLSLLGCAYRQSWVFLWWTVKCADKNAIKNCFAFISNWNILNVRTPTVLFRLANEPCTGTDIVLQKRFELLHHIASVHLSKALCCWDFWKSHLSNIEDMYQGSRMFQTVTVGQAGHGTFTSCCSSGLYWVSLRV